MSLRYIIQQVGYKMGLNPQDAGQRGVLLRFINEACTELYSQNDMVGSMREEIFRVNGDQTIALPPYVGQVRAMREMFTARAIHLNQVRPHYNEFNWKDAWRNWRLKGIVALHTSVRNQSLCTVTVGAIENPPLIVTISGPTPTASRINEVLTMDAVNKTTVNTFLDITSFKKDRPNNYNVILTDIDSLELAVIANDNLQSQYQIIDVSTFPWTNIVTDTLSNYVEVLFKQSLPKLSNDGDEFIAQGYDDIIVNKSLQLWSEEQGKIEEAIAYDGKATRSLARIQEDANRATEDVVALVRNPHDTLQPRIRTGRRWYSRWWNYGV